MALTAQVSRTGDVHSRWLGICLYDAYFHSLLGLGIRVIIRRKTQIPFKSWGSYEDISWHRERTTHSARLCISLMWELGERLLCAAEKNPPPSCGGSCHFPGTECTASVKPLFYDARWYRALRKNFDFTIKKKAWIDSAPFLDLIETILTM